MYDSSEPRGVFAPLLTPLDSDLNPDGDAFAHHAAYLLENGCHGLVPFGTTGEATSFSAEERRMLLETLIDRGIPAERLIVGTGSTAITETAALSAHATDLGCAGVMMLPPFYYKGVSDDGLFAAYSQIIERVGDGRLRIYLYHIPPVSQVPLSYDLIGRLIETFPNQVVGIKDSSGDRDHLLGLLNRFPDFGIFSGSERFLLDVLRRGGRGCISAVANLIADQIRDLYENWEADDADERQEQVGHFRDRITPAAPVPAMKTMLARRYGHEGWERVRPPLTLLTREEREALLNRVDAAERLPSTG